MEEDPVLDHAAPGTEMLSQSSHPAVITEPASNSVDGGVIQGWVLDGVHPDDVVASYATAAAEAGWAIEEVDCTNGVALIASKNYGPWGVSLYVTIPSNPSGTSDFIVALSAAPSEEARGSATRLDHPPTAPSWYSELPVAAADR
jgi:hypothetical protein